MAESVSRLRSRAAISALESHSADLASVLDPFLLSNELCSAGVVESEALDKIITNSSTSREEKAKETVKAVIDRVGTDPLAITKFCNVLSGDPKTKKVAEKLKECYEDTLVTDIHKALGSSEFAKVCHREGLLEGAARLMVKSKSSELYQDVLQTPDKQCRSAFIEQITQSVVPNTDDQEAISTLIRAFMMADLPYELITLLEVVILRENSTFKDNKNLQNLLILTVIKTMPANVMDYANRLDNYDAPDIAKICISKELYEEAFAILKKCNETVSAMEVLVDHIKDMARSKEFAEQCNQPEVWEILNRAQP